MEITEKLKHSIAAKIHRFDSSFDAFVGHLIQDPDAMKQLWKALKPFRGKLSRHRIPISEFNDRTRSDATRFRYLVKHSYLSQSYSDCRKLLHFYLNGSSRQYSLPFFHLVLWRAHFGKLPSINGRNPFRKIEDDSILATLICGSFRKKFIQLCEEKESYIYLRQNHLRKSMHLLLRYDPSLKIGREFSLVERDQQFISECENFWYLFADAIDSPFDISPFIPQS